MGKPPKPHRRGAQRIHAVTILCELIIIAWAAASIVYSTPSTNDHRALPWLIQSRD